MTAAEVVVILQLPAVVAAMVMSVVAMRRGIHDWMPFHAAVGALATVYLVGYGWLLCTDVDRATWSEVMVGVGFVTWPVTWLVPTFMSIHTQKSVDRLKARVYRYEQHSTVMGDGTSNEPPFDGAP